VPLPDQYSCDIVGARQCRALMSNNESFKTNKTCDLLLAAALTLEDAH
jgi:hypothetical protein